MGGENQRGDTLTKATQGASGSFDPFPEFLHLSTLRLPIVVRDASSLGRARESA
jgi:hypothetical protein